MAKTFCLLNHTLTPNQIKELQQDYNSSQIIYPNENIVQLWSQIPLTKSIDFETAYKIIDWLTANDITANDILIIQGEFGMTFFLVDFALKNQIIPIHAVTKRNAKEIRVGEKVEKTYTFEHVCFRKYRYYQSEIQ